MPGQMGRTASQRWASGKARDNAARGIGSELADGAANLQQAQRRHGQLAIEASGEHDGVCGFSGQLAHVWEVDATGPGVAAFMQPHPRDPVQSASCRHLKSIG